MAKTKEELNALKQEINSLTKKLNELSEEELQVITGGTDFNFFIDENGKSYNFHIYKDTAPFKENIK